MAKVIVDEEGRHWRMRRGQLVQIPPEWVGHTVHAQTIAKRKSKRGQGRHWRRKCQR